MTGGEKGPDVKPGKPAVKGDDKVGKPPPKASEDKDIEDGDIATPKRDRDDEDGL
jgi:hypothetical protein